MGARPAKLDSYRDPEVARDYDLRWAGPFGRRRDLRKARALEQALGWLDEQNGGPARRILDIPCGTGRFSRLLAARSRYLGADLSPAMLQNARCKAPDCAFLVADLARLPFPDRAFDVTVCIRFLHLVREPALRIAFLRELRRVSRQGAVIGYHHGRSLRTWGRHLRHRLGLRHRPPGNLTPAAIRGEVEAAGFAPGRWIPVHRGAPLLSEKVLLAAPT